MKKIVTLLLIGVFGLWATNMPTHAANTVIPAAVNEGEYNVNSLDPDAGAPDGTYSWADTTPLTNTGATVSLTNGYTATAQMYTQADGTLAISDGSNLTLIGGDGITGGNIVLGKDATTGTLVLGNNKDNQAVVTTVGASTLTLNAGSNLMLNDGSAIGKDAIVNINNGTFTIAGGSVVLDDADTWQAGIAQSAGTLTFVGTIDETTATKTFNMTGGTLNLGDAADPDSSVDFSLAEGSSITSTEGSVSTVNVNQGSFLTLQNKTNNKAIVKTDGNGSSVVVGQEGSVANLTLMEGSDIKGGEDMFEVNAGSSVTVEGGNLELNDNSTWDGTINLAGGNLKITGNNPYSTEEGGTVYNQTSGVLTLGDSAVDNSGVELTLNEGSSVTGGTVNLNSVSKLVLLNGVENSAKVVTDNVANEITIGDGDVATSLATLAESSIKANSVVTINDKSTLNVGGGSVALNGDVWNGEVALNGGSLTVSGYGEGTPNGKLTANTGILNVTGGTLGFAENSELKADVTTILAETATLDVKGGTVSLNNDNWSGGVDLNDGTLNLSDYNGNNGVLSATAGNLNLTSGKINIGEGSKIDEAVVTSIADGSTLNVNVGTVTLNADDWAGTVELNGGSLDLKGYGVAENGLLVAKTGDLNIINGTVKLEEGSSLAEAVRTNLSEDAVLSIDGGSAIIGEDFTWDGSVSLSSGSLTSNGRDDITVRDSILYNQTGGYLTLANSSLTLEEGGLVTGGTVDAKNSSTLVFNNGAENSAKVLTDENANVVTIGDGATTTTLNLKEGSDIKTETTLTVDTNAALNVETGAEVAIDDEDVWNGALANKGGSISLTGRKNAGADTTSATKTYTQTTGTLSLDDTALTLNANSYIKGGQVNMSNASHLTIDNGLADNQAVVIADVSGNYVVVKKGSTFTMLEGSDFDEDYNYFIIEGGSDIDIPAGVVVTLDKTKDSWEGKVSLIGGELTTKNYTKLEPNGTFIGQTGTLTIDSGVLKIDETSSLAAAVDTTINDGATLVVDGGTAALDGDDDWTGAVELANGDLTVSGYTGNNGKLTTTGGKLTVETGRLGVLGGSSIAEETTVDLKTGSTLSVTGGVANLNSTDTLAGDLSVTGGNLNLNGITRTGKLTQTGGETKILGNFALGTTDSITGGVLVVGDGSADSVLTAGAGTSLATGTDKAKLDIRNKGTLKVEGGSVTLDGTADYSKVNWAGNVDLTSGSLSLTNVSSTQNKTGVLNATGGNLTITNAADVLGTNDTIADAVNLNLTGDLNIKGSTSVNISSADTWNSGALNLDGGSLTLDNISTTGTNKSINATSGNLELKGAATNLNNANDKISYATVVTVNSPLTVNAGNVQLDKDDTLTSGTITLNAGELDLKGISTTNNKLDAKAGTLKIQGPDKTTLNNTGDSIAENVSTTIESGAELEVAKGNVTVDGADIWSGKLTNAGGTINLKNRTGDTTTATQTYNQTSGTLNMNNSRLTLNTSDSSITGGKVTLNEASSLFVNNGLTTNKAIVVTDGSGNLLEVKSGSKFELLNGSAIDAKDVFKIEGGSDLDIKEGVAITMDKSVTGTDWSGKVTLSGGSLTTKNYTAESPNGTLNAQTGSLTVNDHVLTIDGGSTIEGAVQTTLNEGAEIIVKNGGTATFTNNDEAGIKGRITNNGGTVTMDGIKLTGSVDNKIRYNQTAGILKLDNEADLKLGGTTVVGDNSVISGGQVNFEENSGSILRTLAGGKIEKPTVVNLTQGNGIYLTENSGNDPSLVFDNGDNWEGSIHIDGNGKFTLDGYNEGKAATAVFAQDGGSITLLNNSRLTLDNENDYINGGRVIIGGEDNIGNKLTVNIKTTATDATGRVYDATLGKNSSVIINKGNTLEINGTGTAILDGIDDTWSGAVTLSQNGKLTLTGRNDAKSDVTSADKTYIQTGGQLVLDNSSLTLKEGSQITGGEVVIDPSSLVFDNGMANSAKITMIEDDASSLTVKGSDATGIVPTTLTTLTDTNMTKGTVTIGDGTNANKINLANNSVLGANVTLDLKENAELDVKDTAQATLNAGDKWNGKISVNGGSLGVTGNVTAPATGVVLDAKTGNFSTSGNGTSLSLGDGSGVASAVVTNIGEGSTLNLLTGSTLNLNDGDTWGGKVTVNGGILNYADLEAADDGILQATTGAVNVNSGVLDLANGSYIKKEVATDIKNGAGLILEEGGSLTLNGTGTGVDKWDGSVINYGTLTLDAFDNNSPTSSYNQSGAPSSLTMINGSKLTVNGGTSKIESGSVNIGKASGDTGNNTLTIAGGTLAKSVNTSIAKGSALSITGGNATLDNTDTWNGNVNMTAGSLTLDKVTKTTSGDAATRSTYTQTGGNLTLTNGTKLTLAGYDIDESRSQVTGGRVNVGKTGSPEDIGNTLTITDGGLVGYNSDYTSKAQVILNEGNTISLLGNMSGTTPSLTLSNYNDATADVWKGTVTNKLSGVLRLDGFDNISTAGDSANLTYKQDSGSLIIAHVGIEQPSGDVDYKYSNLVIRNADSYIEGGTVTLLSSDGDDINSLLILTDTNALDASGEKYEAMLGENARVILNERTGLSVAGTGTAVLNDTSDPAIGDTWNGVVVLGAGIGDNPTLTLRNVTKDFTDVNEKAAFVQKSGTLNIYANERGGSHLTYNAPNSEQFVDGTINIKGYDADRLSSLKLNYTQDDTSALATNLQGNAEFIINTNEHTVTHSNAYPSGVGLNNTLVKQGSGVYNVNTPDQDLEMGYNLRVENGRMNVNAKSMTIGTEFEGTKYGSLQVGMPGNTEETHFYTNAAMNNIYGDMALNNAWYHVTTPDAYTKVGGNLSVGSGIDMMQGQINRIDVAGTTTVDNMKLRIDVDPASGMADSINSSAVIANNNSVLDLQEYNLLSMPTKTKYTFRVVNADNENYTIGENAMKLVSDKQVTKTDLGSYVMIPSAVKGAFDMVLTEFNPQIYRPQVATNVIYANQLVITNQLFDRMFYSNLPYFNDDCSNKTASANTLFSPYQYTTNDTGLWFKPYGNFETISMTEGLNVKNNSFGALIGADFAKKKWGSWSFIPTAYIGYNGGRSTYEGVGMWHNGGQAGFMGTLTRKNFITAMAVYAGGYYNAMDYKNYNDSNALWNVGVASKTAYNIQLPWHFILQPSLYMAYNYVDGSNFTSSQGNLFYKLDPMNAFSIAPGVTLVWQRDTFSIYALFQTMFSINAKAGGRVGDIDMKRIGITNPYFEYGLGVTKQFKDRFSGYGQAVARSGSRKGIGFQLGLNMKL